MKNSLVLWAWLLAPLTICADGPHLKYVVIVTRHGVRSPTWDAARLNQYSAEPWPDFGVPPGNLTPHGRQAILLMGAYYRKWLAAEKLIHSEGCQDARRVTIYADKDQRTIETGRALSESMFPGCVVATDSRKAPGSDPLFAGTFTADVQQSVEAVRARLDPKLLEHHQSAFDALHYILGPARHKLIDDLSDVIKGPFATGSTLSENLLLEYTNGMKDPGWGRLTREKLFQILEIHAIYADLTRRTPYLASRGSNLLAAILRSMQQSSSGAPVTGALGHPGDVLLILSGHDTNLSNLSGLLSLHWELPGYQPDDTPPGGALIFTLWGDSAGDFVRLRYVAQTVDQMRLLDAGPPETQPVTISGCDPCRLSDFIQR